MTYDVRKAIDADWDEIAGVLVEAFNDEFTQEASDTERLVFEPDRTVVSTLDGTVAGVAAAFTRELTVPGAVIPAAHVTMVSVGATHRRQGLLNRMITNLHETAAALGETVAVLWASEARIYQRYGYGLASRRVSIQARTTDFALLDPSGDPVRAVPPLTSAETFSRVYDRVRATRVGWSDRDERWWRYVLYDGPDRRQGATPLRAVVHDGPDGVDGYMLWRVKGDWEDTGPNGTVVIRELTAATPTAYRALIRFAMSVDLTRAIRMQHGSIAEPLHFMVTDPRRLGAQVHDGLWVRVLDVPGALSARRYAAPIDVVIEIDDPRIPANTGRWHLVGGPLAATCTRTDAPADLAVHVQALGAAYLGGASLVELAAAGKIIEQTAGILAPASIGFGWHELPRTTEIF